MIPFITRFSLAHSIRFVVGQPFYLPAMSPTMEEGTIVKWHAKEGDELEPGDLILELETDEASLDVEAEEDTLLVKILVLFTLLIFRKPMRMDLSP